MKGKKEHQTAYITKALLIIVLYLVLASCSMRSSYPEASVSGGDVVIDIQTLSPDAPRFFSYRFHDKKINFFVMKTNNKVLSFLDACKSCNPKLGFRFDNGYFTCKVCNTRYSVAEVEQGIGGCFPIKIAGELRGNAYHIPVLVFEKNINAY